MNESYRDPRTLSRVARVAFPLEHSPVPSAVCTKTLVRQSASTSYLQ